MAKISQLYNANDEKVYPITSSDYVINPATGTSISKQIEDNNSAIERLGGTINDTNNNINDINNDINVINNNIDNINDDINGIENTITDINQSISDLNSVSTKVDTLETKINDSVSKIDSSEAKVNEAVGILAQTTSKLSAYSSYWWRATTSSSGYLTKLITLSKAGTSAYHSSDSSYYLKICLYDTSSSLQYSSNVSCDSSGNISLVSPSTYSLADGVPNYDWFEGKYIKGLYQNSDLIYYFSSSAYFQIASMTIGSEEYYAMYNFTIDGTAIQVVQAYQVTSNSEAQYISAESSDAYPHSGTVDDITYQYLGLISDFAPALTPFSPTTINFTTANFSNNTYTITIPYSRYFLSFKDSYSTRSDIAGFFGIVVDNKFIGLNQYGSYSNSYASWYYYVTPKALDSSISGNYITMTVSDSTLTLKSNDGGNAGTIVYIPF